MFSPSPPGVGRLLYSASEPPHLYFLALLLRRLARPAPFGALKGHRSQMAPACCSADRPRVLFSLAASCGSVACAPPPLRAVASAKQNGGYRRRGGIPAAIPRAASRCASQDAPWLSSGPRASARRLPRPLPPFASPGGNAAVPPSAQNRGPPLGFLCAVLGLCPRGPPPQRGLCTRRAHHRPPARPPLRPSAIAPLWLRGSGAAAPGSAGSRAFSDNSQKIVPARQLSLTGRGPIFSPKQANVA